jgi:hypothetical protein
MNVNFFDLQNQKGNFGGTEPPFSNVPITYDAP